MARPRRELTVAEEDGVERGEDRAGVHEPLPSPPLALGCRRPPPPLRPRVRLRHRLRLLAPIKNRVLVPAAAIGRCAGGRHRLARRARLPGGVSSPRIGAGSGDHQWPAPRAPKIQANEARGRWEDVDVVLVFLLRFALPFASFFRGRCDCFHFFYFIFLKGRCFHFLSKKSSGLQILCKKIPSCAMQQSSRDQAGIWRPFEVSHGIR